MPPSPELRAMLALHLVPGIGPKLLAALIERFGTATEVMNASAAELTDIPHLGKALAERLRQSLTNRDVDEEITLLEKFGVTAVALGSPDYPKALAEVEGPPPLLYFKGTLTPKDDRAIAIVGSRQCTSYGRRVAERLAKDLALAGYTVVSGLARGIDACAHRGALLAGGRTLAVLAGGLSKIYPPEHAELAEEVAQSGALVTESSMRMEPMSGMFPARNRIISGLSRATVVVEAAEHSGALITVKHASEQGREVFAVPGPVDNPASGGTLKLIRDGARMIRHAGDLLQDLEEMLPPAFQPSAVALPPTGLDGEGLEVWRFLAERPNSADDIAEHLRKSVAEVGRLLMTLELKRVVKRLPGNVYERV